MKKGKFGVLIQIFLVMAFAALGLAACSEESIFTLPQKVTIEQKEDTTSSVSSVSTASGSESEAAETPVTETPTPQTIEPAPLVPVGVVPADPNALTETAKKDVVEAANHRLDTGYYSRETLIAGLISDGFSEEEAAYGADNCYVTWGS